MCIRDRATAYQTRDGRELKTADSRRQVADGRGHGSSALRHLPPAVYRLRLSAVCRLGCWRSGDADDSQLTRRILKVDSINAPPEPGRFFVPPCDLLTEH